MTLSELKEASTGTKRVLMVQDIMLVVMPIVVLPGDYADYQNNSFYLTEFLTDSDCEKYTQLKISGDISEIVQYSYQIVAGVLEYIQYQINNI